MLPQGAEQPFSSPQFLLRTYRKILPTLDKITEFIALLQAHRATHVELINKRTMSRTFGITIAHPLVEKMRSR
jgi:hypothetical protein